MLGLPEDGSAGKMAGKVSLSRVCVCVGGECDVLVVWVRGGQVF